MHFFEFVNDLPLQEDPVINQVIDLIKNDKGFPKDTSDPRVLAKHFYLKVNIPQTTAFQKMLFIYKGYAPNHKIPNDIAAKDDLFLKAVNSIIDLQNSDKNYKG